MIIKHILTDAFAHILKIFSQTVCGIFTVCPIIVHWVFSLPHFEGPRPFSHFEHQECG